MHTEISYAVYLALSATFTFGVARTLYANGRAFLVDAFERNEELADSVNHLLVVGFYLVNLGWAATALELGTKPSDLRGAMEFVTWKVGLVMLVLGAMHFANLYVLHALRRRAERRRDLAVRASEPRQRPGDAGRRDVGQQA